MQNYISTQKFVNSLLLFVLGLITVSCGSYGSLYNSDGIYGDNTRNEQTVVVKNNNRKTMAEVDKQYFGKELEVDLVYDDYFTDIDAYSSVESDTIVKDSLDYNPKAWGYDDRTNVVININNGMDDFDRYWMAMTFWDYSPYYMPMTGFGRGFVNPWRWGWGYSGPAWGYNYAFYNPWAFGYPYQYGAWGHRNFRSRNLNYQRRNAYAFANTRRNNVYSSNTTRRFANGTVRTLPTNRRSSSITRGNSRINTRTTNTIRRRSNTITNPRRSSGNTRIRNGNNGIRNTRSTNSSGTTRTRVKPTTRTSTSSGRSSGSSRGSGRKGSSKRGN